MDKLLVQIIMAYVTSVVGTINTGIARGRMQPWQVDNTFGKLFQNVIAMTAQAKQPNAIDLGSLLKQITPDDGVVKVEEQVEDKVAAVENVLTNNPEIVKAIMAKLP